jgi:hypothetical protein
MTDDQTRERLAEQWLDSSLAEVIGGVGPATQRSSPVLSETTISDQPTTTSRRATFGVGASVVLLGALVLVSVLVFGRGDRDRGDNEAADPSASNPAPLRVLYLGSGPGWGYRYLRSSLDRSTAIELDACLTAEERPGATSAGRLPWSSIAPDFDDYRVVLLGDIRPSDVAAMGEDPAEFARRIEAFVLAGGGLGIFCEGEAMPGAWFGTAMRAVLPIEAPGGMTDCEIYARIRPEHLDHPIFLAMGGTNASSLFDGTRETALTLATVQALGRPRSGAQLLVADRDDSDLPVLVVADHGRGRVAMLTIEDVWRLRPDRPAHVDAFRASLVLWLGDQLTGR